MAENVDATLEENRNLREKIEAVQRERRRSFAEADKVHEEVTARQENERLKQVLSSQEALLEAAVKSKEAASEPRKTARQVPYTITKDGPVYSTPNHKKAEPEATEPPAAPRLSGPFARTPNAALGGASNTADSGDENKEN